MRSAPVLLLALVAGSEAHAHAGHVHWLELGTTWTWKPWVMLPLAISGELFAGGVARLWRRAGIVRGLRQWEAACFALGRALRLFTLAAPLHRLRPERTAGATGWGLTPLEGRQLAGLFMWIPGGLVYAGAALVLAGRWINGSSGGDHAVAAR